MEITNEMVKTAEEAFGMDALDVMSPERMRAALAAVYPLIRDAVLEQQSGGTKHG